jgi:protein-L-isoaspartate(D-aspartate) O-methyltransferase
MNVEQARFNMVEQQIRTWEVLDPVILSLIATLKRENFVSAAHQALAFADLELPLPNGEKMWTPKMEARVVQDLQLTGLETVLEIGTGSGYLTALLAARSQHVTSLEIDAAQAVRARAALAQAGVFNADVMVDDGMKLAAAPGTYDVVVFGGSLPVMLEAAIDWLKPGGRIFAAVGQAPAMQARVIRKTPEGSVSTKVLFETVIAPLKGAPQPNAFTF